MPGLGMVGAGVAAAPVQAGISRFMRWHPSGDLQGVLGVGSPANLNASIGLGGLPAFTIMSATGTGTRNVALFDGEPVMEIVGSGSGVVLLYPGGYTYRLGAAAGGAISQQNPIFRHIFRLARAIAGTPADDFFGIYFHPYAGTTPASPGTTGVGFGLTGDGAGAWKFIARKVGGAGLTINTVLSWPLAVTKLIDVEFRIYPASGASGARLFVLVDGVPKVIEPWDSGRLPIYADGSGGTVQYGWSIRHQNAAYPNIELASITDMEMSVNI